VLGVVDPNIEIPVAGRGHGDASAVGRYSETGHAWLGQTQCAGLPAGAVADHNLHLRGIGIDHGSIIRYACACGAGNQRKPRTRNFRAAWIERKCPQLGAIRL